MNLSSILIFLVSSALLGSCPLGYPPEQACPEDSPSCALYVDGDGDSLCDNPGPQPAAGSEPSEEPPPDTSQTVPDTLVTETESIPDSLPGNTGYETSPPDDSVFMEVPPESTTWTDESSVEDSSNPGTVLEDSVPSSNRVTILSDSEGDLFCINPDHVAADHYNLVWEINERVTDSSVITGQIQIELSDDSVFIDTITIEEMCAPISSCPLGYLPEEACLQDDPFCAYFTDADGDSFCDNPGAQTDSSSTVSVRVTGRTYSLVPFASGCPLGLPPEAACPSAENALSPHYMGWNGCVNPSGGGINRTRIVLITTAVLLPVATCLKRRFRGRRKEDRRKRKIAHITVQIISLLVLGFFVQGCFCPLGVTQYALLPGGLIFLGGLGIAVLILPIIWTTFFDRIYCGWVCPFGALQDLLGKLHIPRPPKFSHRVHAVLSGFRYLLAIMFFGFLLLASSGQFASITPRAFFCKYDPFHTIFSFFIVGSFTGAIATLSVLVFFPRFFCKYLCFYGAILSFLGRVGLWKRFTGRHPCDDAGDNTRE